MKFTLSKKIILSTTLTILFFGSLATLSVFFYVKNTVVEIEKSHLELLSKNSAREIFREFSDTQQAVELVAIQPEIINSLSGGDDSFDANDLLNKYNIKDKYSALYIISRDGVTKASTDPEFINQNYGFREYFAKSISGQTTVEAAIGVTSHQTGYYVSSPVRDTTGLIVGVVVAKVKPETINQLALQSGLTGVGHVMLVDDYGVIIYSDISDRIYKSLGGLNEFEREAISKLQRFSNIDIKGLDYEPVYQLIKQNKKNGILEFYDAADKSDEILAMNRIGNLPYYLVFEEDTDTFSYSAFNVGFLVSLFVALAATMAAFIIAVLTRGFLRPFNTIISALKSIGAGKYENKIIINSNDELSTVANVLNEMLDKIKKHEYEIDTKIKKRTKDLEKFNRLMVGREIRMIELKKNLDDIKNNVEKEKPFAIIDSLKTGIGVEEKIIRELDAFYTYKIKNSDLPKEKKQKILKLLNILTSESKKHYQIINSIIEDYEGR